MKRKLTILLLCLLTLLACSCSKNTAKTETTEETESSTIESEAPTPTPASTYTPGDDLYGMLSVTGDVVIEPQYNYLGLFTQENLARFQDYETGLWGYINESGEEVIPAQYEDAQDFSEGLAAVEIDGLYGFIDVSGEMVIAPQFEGVGSEFAYENCVIQENGMQGVIDQTGKVILEVNYLSVTLCCETYYVVQCEDKMYQVLDQSGNVMAEDEAEIYMVTDSGYYFVKTDSINDNMYDFEGNQYYVSARYFNPIFVINDKKYVIISNDTNTAWGLFNLDTGEYLIEPTNQGIQLADDEQNRNKIVYILSSEICGFASAVTGEVILPNNLYWIIRDKGDYVFYATSEEDYFCVGVMNLAGEIITPDQYSCTFAVSADGQIALERQDGRSIVISGSREEVLLTEEDICICGYVPLLDSWLYRNARTYSMNEETGYWDCDSVADENMGILTRDGEVAIANDYPFIILDNGSVFCCDSDTSAEFVDTDLTLVKVDSIVTLIDCTTQSNTLVTIDGEGRYGLIDSQGNVLYAASDIRIYTNIEYSQYDVASETTSEGEASHPSEYVNSEYNDSNYYLISKEAK